MSIFYFQVTNAKKQRKVKVYNARKNASRVRRDYAVDGLVYVDNTGIYIKIEYNKHGL